MARILWCVSLTALVALMVEVTLIRVFDVILTPNLAYLVISLALFGLGIAGIFSVLRPIPPGQALDRYLTGCAGGLGISVLLLVPGLNLLPFRYEEVFQHPVAQLLAFGGLWLLLTAPFFLGGLLLVRVFAAFPSRIHQLYFADLLGAGLGVVLLVPLLPVIGPGGVTLVGAALMIVAILPLVSRPARRVAATLLAVVLGASAWLLPDSLLDVKAHSDKRGVREAERQGAIEFSRWDPISRVEVIDLVERIPSDTGITTYRRKHIAYDGGSQSSHFYPFDGDFSRLRGELDAGAIGVIQRNFWNRGVLAAHYLERDRHQRVLVIGSAGGQEIRAALTYGAGRVEGVELVGTVLALGKGLYAGYTGGLLNDPRVHLVRGEGRSFLRASPNRYDIIQIFSNFTSSSIGAGTGAVQPTYLHTAEAYREYFDHLTPDGVLQVTHHAYPRVVTTAALAWKQSGRQAFRRHVAVFERRDLPDWLPTVLIRMQPWDSVRLGDLAAFLGRSRRGEPAQVLVDDPVDTTRGFLPAEFYAGRLPDSLLERVPYRITPATDDKPFFGRLRRVIRPLSPDSSRFVTAGVAAALNRSLIKGWVPMDQIHLWVTGLLSVLFATGFVVIPLRRSLVGRAHYGGKTVGILYFSCLGTGFIMLELAFIHLMMKLVGFPLYTYTTVLFSLLLFAGLGSAASDRLGISPSRRWRWPFAGVLGTGAILLLVHPLVSQLFLAAPTAVRITVAALLIAPLGFFLGIPFPLGIQVVARRPPGAVAWAWAMNGVCTVAGGLLCMVLALQVGFRLTILMALATYGVAFGLFSRLRKTATDGSGQPEPLEGAR